MAKKKEEQPAAQPASAEAAAADGARKKKRRRSSKPADEQQLPQDELARRQRQRHLRDLALRLRAEGKEYKKGKHKKHKPRRRVQLIIVPIFWQKKAGEKASVLEAAERVQELLRGLGVKCDTDTTTELTPGQKFRHWEEKGVMLRVELGPKEAAEGTCMLAVCKKAGEVAKKQTVSVGPQLCEQVKQQIEAMGLALAPPAAPEAAAAGEAAEEAAGAEEQEAAEEQPGGKSAKKAKKTAAAEEGPAAAQGQQAAAPQQPQQAQEQPKQQQRVDARSVEDVEGDFAGMDLLQEPSAGKKGKKKAARAAEVESEVDAFRRLDADGEEGEGEEAQAGGKQKKKGKKGHTLVKF